MWAWQPKHELGTGIENLEKNWKSRSFTKQKRSTEGCSKFKSPETRQVKERLVSTLEHMQVPKWDGTRCPEELNTRCFGVNVHPYYQMSFFFARLRSAQFVAKDIHLQIHGILSNNSLCLRFNMTLTTRNMSFSTKPFIANSKVWDRPLHTVAVAVAIFGLFCGYRIICPTNMFYFDSTMTTHHHWMSRNPKCMTFKI